jgi:hypothetical protein
MPFRLSLAALLLLAVAASGCDTTDDTALDVFVVDLEFDDDDYSVDGLYTASFASANAVTSGDDLFSALQTAGQGDLVMLYIDSNLIVQFEPEQELATWSPLPLSRGFNEALFPAADPADDELFTTLTVSYEYSFEDGNVYFDVVSSLPYTQFDLGPDGDPRDYFDSILPRRFASETADDILLRLVVIPDELFFTDGAARVNLRDYEAVQRAYDLPD